MDFFYVYVLFSLKDFKLYIGYTSDLEARKRQHFGGEVLSTAPRRPLEIIYYESHLSQKDALRREKYFKTSSGRRTLKMMLRTSLEERNYQGL